MLNFGKKTNNDDLITKKPKKNTLHQLTIKKISKKSNGNNMKSKKKQLTNIEESDSSDESEEDISELKKEIKSKKVQPKQVLKSRSKSNENISESDESISESEEETIKPRKIQTKKIKEEKTVKPKKIQTKKESEEEEEEENIEKDSDDSESISDETEEEEEKNVSDDDDNEEKDIVQLRKNEQNKEIESDPLEVQYKLLKLYNNSTDEIKFNYCFANCSYENCCNEKCCSESEKEQSINELLEEKKNFNQLLPGSTGQRDSVYQQVREGLICGLQKPKSAKNFIIEPCISPHRFMLKEPFEIAEDGLILRVTPEQAQDLYINDDIKSKKNFYVTQFALLQKISITHADLTNWPDGIDWLVTLRTDSSNNNKHKIFANQKASYFNNSTSTTKYGSIVSSGKTNNNTISLNNNNCMYNKKHRNCLIETVLNWWNIPTPHFLPHKSDSKKCVIKLEDTEHPGYADNVFAFWLTRYYFPMKKLEILKRIKSNDRKLFDRLESKRELPLEYTNTIKPYFFKEPNDNTLVSKKINNKKGKTLRIIQLNNNNSSIDESSSSLQIDKIGNENYLEFDRAEILKHWHIFQDNINRMHPFIDFSNGFYLHLEPLNKDFSEIVARKFKNMINKSNYTIEAVIVLSNLLAHSKTNKKNTKH